MAVTFLRVINFPDFDLVVHVFPLLFAVRAVSRPGVNGSVKTESAHRTTNRLPIGPGYFLAVGGGSAIVRNDFVCRQHAMLAP